MSVVLTSDVLFQTASPMTSKQFLSLQDRGERNELHLDAGVVRSFLLSKEVADKPVVVISVAGAFRTGKSFLLNSMTRYLKASDKSRWLDDKSESFPWKGGEQAHTNGMTMSQPIPVTLQSGEEAVLLLMDTQGIFDENSTKTDSTKIFALSTLLSSVQIFNLMQNLKSDDLENLMFFAEYGRLAMENTEGKPFQNLLFLIRDWPHTQDRALGSQGGTGLVEQRLSGSKEGQVQIREHIRSCFTSVKGFLLPYPGEKVTGSATFTGDAEDMKPDFTTALEQLMSELLSPESLSVKMNGSRPMTCRQLATLIQTYTDLFRSEKLPDARSILQVVAEASNMAAVNDELLTYTKRMMELLGEDAPRLDEKLLNDEREKARKDALKSLDLQKTLNDPTKTEDYYSHLLLDKIEDWLKTSQSLFKEKCKRDMDKIQEENERLVDECISSFDKSMKSVNSDRLSNEQSIRELHTTARKEALLCFSNKVATLGSYSGEESKQRLENTLDGRLQAALEEKSNLTAVDDELKTYVTRMEDLLSEEAPMLDEALIFDEHSRTKTERLQSLKSRLTLTYSAEPESHFSRLLADSVEGWFTSSQGRIKNKCERNRQKAIEMNGTLLDQCISVFTKSMNIVKSSEPIGEKKIRQTYNEAKTLASTRFNNEVVTFGAYNAEELEQRLQSTMEKELLTVLERDEENANTAAVQNQFLRYEKRMKGLLCEDAERLDESLLSSRHNETKVEALDALKPQIVVINSTKSENHFSRQLTDKIENWFKTSQSLFKDKCKRDMSKTLKANERLVDECISFFDKSMKSVNSDRLSNEQSIRELHTTARKEALLCFSNKVATLGSYSGEESKQRLENTLDGRLQAALEEKSNLTAVDDELKTYVTRMEDLLSEEAPMLDEALIFDEHSRTKTERLQSLKSRLTLTYSAEPESHFSRLLADSVEGWFTSSQDRIKKKCERNRQKAIKMNGTLFDQCISVFTKLMNTVKSSEPIGEKKIRRTYNKAKTLASTRFTNEVVTFGSYRAEDIQQRLQSAMEKELQTILEREEENTNIANVQHEFLCYRSRMMDLLCEDEEPLDEDLLFNMHNKTKDEKLDALQSKLIMNSLTKPQTYYIDLLANKVENWFKTSPTVISEKWMRDKWRAEKENEELVEKCIESYKTLMNSLDTDNLKEDKLCEEDSRAQEKVKKQFEMDKNTHDDCNVISSREKLAEVLQENSAEWFEEYKERQEKINKAWRLKVGAAVLGTVGVVVAGPAAGLAAGMLAAEALAGVAVPAALATAAAVAPAAAGVTTGTAIGGTYLMAAKKMSDDGDKKYAEVEEKPKDDQTNG